MRVSSSAVLAALAGVATLSLSVQAFQPQAVPSSLMLRPENKSPSLLTRFSTAAKETEASPCEMPNEVIPADLTARNLRSAVLTNVRGEKVRLDEKMGSGTSIVVFLRHMG